MIHWLWLIPALILGGFIGVVTTAIVGIGAMSELDKERYL